ncbi:PBP1A family penicillin-binding protein [Candidatus Falkowbacteria bacterium]|nr:PBP1A family penicillin-binding protein [Candidatus Falkowbacteria bacterium]
MSHSQHHSEWKNQRPHKNSLFAIIIHLIKKPFKLLTKNKEGVMKNAIAGLVLAGLFGSLVLVAAFGIFSRQLPDVHSILNRFVAESTKIYDNKGETLLYEFHGDEKRTIVELSEISPNVINALISAEDKNFYEHKGFSILGIIRSVIRNTFTDSRVGGSTLTQQMIKNTVLTNEKTYTRKIKELILARKAEQEFTKEEILKVYLNTINYGGVNYGVESASQAFFGKSSKDVTLADAAVLAAIPQRPTYLSPYGKHLDVLKARQEWVLDRMQEEGYITKEQSQEAKGQELVYKEQKIQGSITAPHFVFYVHDQLIAEFGEELVNQGGLKVITTLDAKKQEVAEKAIHDANEKNLEKGATNAALVSLDAKNGEILAMVGSQDFFNDEIDGKVNIVTSARQPGSSIKPIVYATAIEKGFTTETVVYDVNTNFAVSGKAYEPKNYDLKERGPITFRNALAQSLNIPAVKAMYLAGVPNVMKKLVEDLTYSTIKKEQDCGLSLVLGGCEVTLLDHASAYTGFARDGEMSKAVAIKEVYDTDGKKIFDIEYTKKKVWEPQTARAINSILTDNVARTPVFGPTSYLQLGDRPVAAKTGTTNDYNDAWAMGYTPSFVTGVWVGNSDGTDMKRGADGSVVAAPIWNAYMRGILQGTPVETFKAPDPLPENIAPVLRGVLGGTVEVEIDRISQKLATEFTPATTREKKIFTQHHDILHFVRKDDPRGAPPDDPAVADGAYGVWEQAVQNWVTRDLQKRKEEALAKGEPWNDATVNAAPPTEYDDVHKPELVPSLTVTNVTNNQVIDQSTYTVTVQANAPRGISKVEYKIDGVVNAVNTFVPYSGTLSLAGIPSGFHTLTVTAFDDVENQTFQNFEINIKQTSSLPSLIISAPTTMTTSGGAITVNASTLNGIKTLNLISVGPSNLPNLSTSLSSPTSTPIQLQWTPNEGAGTYTIYTQGATTSNATVTSNSITVTVQ